MPSHEGWQVSAHAMSLASARLCLFHDNPKWPKRKTHMLIALPFDGLAPLECSLLAAFSVGPIAKPVEQLAVDVVVDRMDGAIREACVHGTGVGGAEVVAERLICNLLCIRAEQANRGSQRVRVPSFLPDPVIVPGPRFILAPIQSLFA